MSEASDGYDDDRGGSDMTPSRNTGSENGQHSPEQLREYLDCWRLPGGRLEPAQARALLDWSDTPEEERERLKKSLELTQQQVPTRSLAPTQRRGHVSWLDRLKGVFRP